MNTLLGHIAWPRHQSDFGSKFFYLWFLTLTVFFPIGYGVDIVREVLRKGTKEATLPELRLGSQWFMGLRVGVLATLLTILWGMILLFLARFIVRGPDDPAGYLLIVFLQTVGCVYFWFSTIMQAASEEGLGGGMRTLRNLFAPLFVNPGPCVFMLFVGCCWSILLSLPYLLLPYIFPEPQLFHRLLAFLVFWLLISYAWMAIPYFIGQSMLDYREEWVKGDILGRVNFPSMAKSPAPDAPDAAEIEAEHAAMLSKEEILKRDADTPF